MSLAAIRTAPLNGLPELPCYRWQGMAADPTELLTVAELAAEHLGIGPAAMPERKTVPVAPVTLSDADPDPGFDPPEHPRDQAAAQRLAAMNTASTLAPLPGALSRLFVTATTTPSRRKPRRRNRCRTCHYLLISVGHRVSCGGEK